MSQDIFERVSQLVEQFQKQAGEAKGTKKQAFEVGDLSEYDVGKRVKPKDFLLSKEVEDLLGDTLPNNPSVSTVEEGDEQDDIDAAYPTAPDTSVSTEEGPDVEEVREPLGGEEAMKDASVRNLSDAELLDKLASAAYSILYQYALIEPSKTLIKSGAFGKQAAAAYQVADTIKQADYDADLLMGCISGILKTAEEANLEDATTPEDAAAADPAAVLADASPEEIAEVLQEDPELAAAVAGGVAQEDPAAVLADASPEEIAEVLQEDPELAAALTEAVSGDAEAAADPAAVLADASPEEIAEVLQEDPELAAVVADGVTQEEAKEAAYLRKLAEDAAAADPAAVLADASPEEIAEVLQEDPELAAAIAGGVAQEDPAAVLADASPEEIAEVLQEDPELAAAIAEAVGTPGAGMETPAEEAAEGHPDAAGSEEAEGKETEEEETAEKEGSVLAKVAALSEVLRENNITPEELAFYTSGGPKAKDAVKVANAVRNFRNKFKGKNVKEADSPRLKEHMRQFLQELLVG